jgi:hypothetical protein
MKENRPQSRKQDLVQQEVDGELLIYDLERNKAFCLNQTSMLVWQACDGKRTIAEINDWLGRQLRSQVDEDIVWLALDQLKRENLIDGDKYLPEKFDGMDRRAVIKTIGLSTMASLPVIASLTAPMAVHANSLCMTVLMGCMCGLTGEMGVPVGSECMPAGIGAAPCMDAVNCRCIAMGVGVDDDCVP